MYLSADNWSTSIVDDNSGGGTTARIVYTNSDSIPRRVVIRPSTPFVDYGEPGNTGTYVFSAEWGP